MTSAIRENVGCENVGCENVGCENVVCAIREKFCSSLLKIEPQIICEKCIKLLDKIYDGANNNVLEDKCFNTLLLIIQLIHEYEQIVTIENGFPVLAYDKISRLIKERIHTVSVYGKYHVTLLLNTFHFNCTSRCEKIIQDMSTINIKRYDYYSLYDNTKNVIIKFKHPKKYKKIVKELLRTYISCTKTIKLIKQYTGSNEYVEGIGYTKGKKYKYLCLKDDDREVKRISDGDDNFETKKKVNVSVEIFAHEIYPETKYKDKFLLTSVKDFLGNWLQYYKNTKYEYFKIKEANKRIKQYVDDLSVDIRCSKFPLEGTKVYFYIKNNYNHRKTNMYSYTTSGSDKFTWDLTYENNKNHLFYVIVTPFFSREFYWTMQILSEKYKKEDIISYVKSKKFNIEKFETTKGKDLFFAKENRETSEEITNWMIWIQEWYLKRDSKEIRDQLEIYFPKGLSDLIIYLVL